MKYLGGTKSSLFCEQVHKVTELYEQWSDCERTVVIYALLKRLPFSCLRFIQSAIESNLTQTYCLDKVQLLEKQSNCLNFMTHICDLYKNFPKNLINGSDGSSDFNQAYDMEQCYRKMTTAMSPASFKSASNISMATTINFSKYTCKEDILNDILTYLPILRPGNDDVKSVYLSLIPLAVEDAVKGVVNTAMVQQIFSFLLIHPAFTTNDRRSLSKFLRYLEDHITNNYSNIGDKSVGMSTNKSNLRESISPIPPAPWQTIKPPHIIDTSMWDNFHLSQRTIDKNKEYIFMKNTDLINSTTTGTAINSTNSTTSSLSHVFDVSNGSSGVHSMGAGSGSTTSLATDCNTNDDHHISFSKNGTEILDFECDDYDKSNTQIATFQPDQPNEYLLVPNVTDSLNSSGSIGCVKTRRSNSLTTAAMTATITNKTNGGGGGSTSSCTSSSSENLALIAQKPRSFSLSMEIPRAYMTTSGSESRLNEFKPNYLQFTSHNIGMSNIGQWLKSLRLHKYVWLFSKLTYEQMMEITEEYLQNLGVTKGARHKLVICINKLKERFSTLCQIESDLKASPLNNSMYIRSALDELMVIVLTPMKPVRESDVARQFLTILQMIGTMLCAKQHHLIPTDEELIDSMLWIIDKAVSCEAFIAEMNQLKELQFKMSKMKMQFPTKQHYNGTSKSSSSISLVKSRWLISSKPHKSASCGDKPHRKNSNGMQLAPLVMNQIENYPGNCNTLSKPNKMVDRYQVNQQQNKNFLAASNAINSQPTHYTNKSSSYPNFSCGTGDTDSSTNTQLKNSSTDTTIANIYQPFNRHSASNLISTNNTTGTTPTKSNIIASAKSGVKGAANNILSANKVSFVNCTNSFRDYVDIDSEAMGRACTNDTMIIGGLINHNNNLLKMNCVDHNSHTITSMNSLNAMKNCCNRGNSNLVNVLNSSKCNNYFSDNRLKGGKERTQHGTNNAIVDINSRLEFLCLQMTEQAIN